MSDNTPYVNKMNVNPGGKQKIMRDGFWNGKLQHLNYAIGIPKGLHVILEEGDIDRNGMNEDQIREILGSHKFFKMKNLLLKGIWERKRSI